MRVDEVECSCNNRLRSSWFFFDQFRTITKNYPLLFPTSKEGESESGDTPNEDGGFEQDYKWHIWLDKLSKEDNCKWSDIYLWSGIELLNRMEYIKAKENRK